MAGHSAWKNIKHRKAAVDAKRGKVWSKCSRAIIVAAKAGGGDPKFNTSLRYAIDEAKAQNMPRDTIEKAVKKGTGEAGGDTYQAVRYEGYAAGGVAIIADCLVANTNKTAAEIRTLFDKNGGNLGVPGSVGFSFAQKGIILIDVAKVAEDRLMEIALDSGAEDVVGEDGAWRVVTPPTEFMKVREAIEAAGIAVDSAEITFIPANEVECNVDLAAKVLKLIDVLEDHDDVQKVYTNASISDEVSAQL